MFKQKRERIVGIVLGNQITEMTVYREEETLNEGGEKTTLIKTEALRLGMAIRADVVLTIPSTLLGRTIGDWLQRYGLRE